MSLGAASAPKACALARSQLCETVRLLKQLLLSKILAHKAFCTPVGRLRVAEIPLPSVPTSGIYILARTVLLDVLIFYLSCPLSNVLWYQL